MSMTTTGTSAVPAAVIAAIKERRLRNNWSWVRTAAEINRLTLPLSDDADDEDVPISDRTVRHIIQVNNGQHVLDRTAFKLEQYAKLAAAEDRDKAAAAKSARPSPVRRRRRPSA